ncbi:HDIG domain-containing protein [Balneolaceae bacterium ANBcel3]|nr:HDIG domain-containing protein [Balneolaceae bacterium ANBcel3]
MGLLEKLGLHRKKKAYIPFTTEKVKKDVVPGIFSKNNLVKFFISIAFLAIVIALYPKTPLKETAYSIGEPWRNDDLTAPFSFSILKDEAELEAERREIERNTPPVFIVDNEIKDHVSHQLDFVFQRMDTVLIAYLEWQESKRLDSQHAVSDSLFFIRSLNRSGIGIDDVSWYLFLDSYVEAYAPVRQNRMPSHRFIGTDIKHILQLVLENVYARGVIDQSKDDILTEEVVVRNLEDHTEREVPVSQVRTLRETRDYARRQLSTELTDEQSRAGVQLLNLVLQPNLFFNEEATENIIRERIENISPTKGAVSSGQVIIRRGDIITAERHNILLSLNKARAERTGDIDLWKQYIGETILVVSVFMIFFLYIYLYRRKIFDNNAMLMLVFLTILLVYSVGAFVARMEDVSPFIVPFAIAPILLTIIFDSRVGIMTTTLLALLAGLMYGNSFEFVITTITACSIGVYSVRDIKDRSQFYLTTPALILIAYAVVLFGFTLTKVDGWSSYTDNLLFLLGNAVGIWLTYPLILLIEKTFKITTDVTLLELSDTNQDLLRKLMLEAPGSFHHSLQVANLAEAAATGIGANSLLCRVGALYHDIGKLDKPQYFVENQQNRNAHDRLKPRMSALIIKNHVDVGVKMANDAELPQIITDFIETHHGTSLIRFFYEKALTESENDQEIQEEDFRYDGPIPNSKETGIVMLADGVEAASRSMSDHSYQKLENLVNRLVDDRLNEGQLNNCSLTLKDLNIIKDIFTRILQGMYHGRIKYPGQDDSAAPPAESRDTPSNHIKSE